MVRYYFYLQYLLLACFSTKTATELMNPCHCIWRSRNACLPQNSCSISEYLSQKKITRFLISLWHSLLTMSRNRFLSGYSSSQGNSAAWCRMVVVRSSWPSSDGMMTFAMRATKVLLSLFWLGHHFGSASGSVQISSTASSDWLRLHFTVSRSLHQSSF